MPGRAQTSEEKPGITIVTAEPAWPSSEFPDFSGWTEVPERTGFLDVDGNGEPDFRQITLSHNAASQARPQFIALRARVEEEAPILVFWEKPDGMWKIALRTLGGSWKITEDIPDNLGIFLWHDAAFGFFHVILHQIAPPGEKPNIVILF